MSRPTGHWCTCLKCEKLYEMDFIGYSNPTYCPECTKGRQAMMKCDKCKKEFNRLLANCGAGNTWHLHVCPHCGWNHYSGYYFPCESMWQEAKDGKASIDFGPQHHIGKLAIGPNAGLTKKVYCEDCKWIKVLDHNVGYGPVHIPPAVCTHETNKNKDYKDTWYCRYTETDYCKPASELNKNNDCPLMSQHPAQPTNETGNDHQHDTAGRGNTDAK